MRLWVTGMKPGARAPVRRDRGRAGPQHRLDTRSWLTRFGRTTVVHAVHAVEAIGERLRSGPRESQVTVAGWRLDRIAGGGDVAASIAGAMDN